MALFKILRGIKNNLPTTLVDGQVYLTTDEMKLYFDVDGSTRKELKVSKADSLDMSSNIGGSKQPVYFNANGKPVAIDHTINKSVPSDAVFTDYQATYAGHYAPGEDTSAALTANASSTASNASFGSTSMVTGVTLKRDAKGHVVGVNVSSAKMPNNPNTNYTTNIRAGVSGDNTNSQATNPYIKVLDNSTYRSQIQLKGSGATAVNSDANGVITISSTDTKYTLPVATSTALGGVKSGTDITVDASGNVSVNNNSHSHTVSNISDFPSDLVRTSSIGQKNGVASLGSDGKVPAAQLPSYVDDVIEGYLHDGVFYQNCTVNSNNTHSYNTQITPETGKIYVDKHDNKTYRHSTGSTTGGSYVEISASLALGTTSSTAFQGDLGNTAYVHATKRGNTAYSSGLYKITVNDHGHVTAATAVGKGDITALGIPGQDTTYTTATTSANGLMSSGDKTKLNGIANGAEVNQNAFSNVTINQGGSTTNLAADSKTDTLTLKAGANITLSADANSDTITITSKDTTYSNATSSAAGLMSSADKGKLDGIAANANNYSLPAQYSDTVTASNTIKIKAISAPTSSGGTSYSNGSSGQVLKSNGSTIYWAADNNSDTKVTQTVTSTNASYPILLAPSGQSGTTTTTAYFNSGVTINPSTKVISANITGYADAVVWGSF